MAYVCDVHAYKIMNRLGAGGYARVYRARRIGREFALKVFVDKPRAARAWKREVDIMLRIGRTARVPEVYAAWRDAQDRRFILMELCPGEDLYEYASRVGDVESALPACVRREDRVVLDVWSAVHALHGMGVLHRDVKMENVMVDAASGRGMLVDMGFACKKDARTAETFGTRCINPPELTSPEAYEAAAEECDYYQTGAMAFELWTRLSWEECREAVSQGGAFSSFDFRGDHRRRLCEGLLSDDPEERRRTWLLTPQLLLLIDADEEGADKLFARPWTIRQETRASAP